MKTCKGFKLSEDTKMCINYKGDLRVKESCINNCKLYSAKGKVAKYNDMDAIVE